MHKGSNRMPGECNHLCFCPIKGIIDIIGKKWSLLVINALRNQGKLRFNDLMKQLGGISPKTLSDTLKELQVEKLIQRESFAEIPPRVEYALSRRNRTWKSNNTSNKVGCDERTQRQEMCLNMPRHPRAPSDGAGKIR